MMLLKTLLSSLFFVASLAGATEPRSSVDEPTDAGVSSKQPPLDWQFPKDRKLEEGTLTIHAPQVVSWENFEKASLLIAVEFQSNEKDAPRIYATVELSNQTEIDMAQRLVIISEPKVERVLVAGEPMHEYAAKLSSALQRDTMAIPLDIFLISLAHDVLESEENDGFNPNPPDILVAGSPTIILSINGEPLVMPMGTTDYSIIGNSNWPLLKLTESENYYLLHKQTWWKAENLDGPWQKMAGAPAGLDALDPEGEFSQFLIEIADTGDISIQHVTKPTELITIDGEPEIEAIEEAQGLSFVSNTQSPLFVYKSTVYFLASGRWFATSDLQSGTWSMLRKLPEVFSNIPVDHGMGYVRASVPGTLEARTALLEASLPEKKTVPADKSLVLENQYVGEPKFEKIANTSITRATNSGYEIFLHQGVFYLCYEGAWYQSDNAEGPWTPAFRVPDVLYNIPASSPSYPVTQVKVASSTSTSVVYVASSSYYSGIYSYYGMPVYGTGWYYPPYYRYYYHYGYYPHAYYPYYRSYGYGSYYNARTGTYANRSVWAGPYGGYSYNQHNNSRTGRYGYVETAWNSNEWASYGETYNPRTNISTETKRYYSDDTNRFEMEREITRGDQSIETRRDVDLDDGWSKTTRESSEGDSMSMERQRESDGSYSSEGSITTREGKTAKIEGQIDNGQRRTEITGADGGKAISGGDGQKRGTVGKDAEGNLYAGHNGNVYKKSGDGWYSYDRGEGWNEMKKPDGGPRAEMAAGKIDDRTRQRMSENTGRARSQAGSFPDYSQRQQTTRMNQLQRDSQSRNRGNQQFQSRRNNSQFNRSSMGGRASRGGGMRAGGRRRQ